MTDALLFIIAGCSLGQFAQNTPDEYSGFFTVLYGLASIIFIVVGFIKLFTAPV